MTALLEVENLRVRFEGNVDALTGVSLYLERGESLAIVGESGSGKSTLALCLIGLIQPPVAQGSVCLDGQELMGARPELLRALRWTKVALAMQGAPFNPVVSVGDQIAEPLREHRGMTGSAARRRAAELAADVLLDPSLLDRFPHQLSGGERRRATLAMVFALDPSLLILDEPTEGLDPATARELVERVIALRRMRNSGLVVIAHNLPDAARLATRSMVLYAGEAMETGATSQVIGQPAHPYSWALVNSYPVMTTTKDLRPIRGEPPDARALPSGCPFHPRCTQAEDICRQQRPPLLESQGRLVACHFGGLKTLLSATQVQKAFRSGRHQVLALRGISLTVREGESVGIIGPSGSGKSTLARILAGHLAPDFGQVHLEGVPLTTGWGREERRTRRRIQLVMQDPWDALSPRLSVEALVREPLDLLKNQGSAARAVVVGKALESVGLPPSGSFLQARSHELSGGQLQRVALARALVSRPKLLVADEPTSMLDASEQARLLVTLRERQMEMGLGLLFISHDVAVVRKVTDRIVILDAGQIVEEGPSSTVSSQPRSLAGRRLIEAAPMLAPNEVLTELATVTHERRS